MTGLTRAAAERFLEEDGFFLAAGLSFYAVLCVVPFTLLLISAGGFLLSDEEIVRRVMVRLAEALPVYQREVEAILAEIVRGRRVSGLLGTVTLVLLARQVLSATRVVLNRMLGLPPRSWLRGVLFDLGMVAGLAVLFLATVGVTGVLAWLERWLAGRRPVLGALFEWLGPVVGTALNTALFAVLYRFVPARRVPWPSVLHAAVVTGVLWELAKQLFRVYIERLGTYSAVYGPLGVTVALIMWVYYSAVVFVAGAAVIRVLETRRAAGPP